MTSTSPLAERERQRADCRADRRKGRRHSLQPVAQAALIACFAAPLAARAQTTPTPVAQLPRVEINATAVPPITQVTEDIAASPANVTVLGRKELDQKTISTYGDIFRGLTGVYVNEYGQGLVAYELKFRGFASGHGRDVAAFLDGMPLNVTGSQHTNGYMDLAQLIPELLDRVEIVRGPFSPYAGNHAVAGSVQMYTDRNVASQIKASVDSFGRVRALPILSTTAGPGHLVIALDATKGDGYTRQSEVERANLFTRYSFPIGNGTAAVRYQAYRADAQAPGYLDLARIQSGDIDRRAALTHGLGDTKRQQNVVFNFRSDDAEGRTADSGITANLYALRDRRERYTSSELSLPPESAVPIGAERDRLHQAGGELRKVTSFALAAMPSQLAVGVQYNRERVDAVNFRADANRNELQPSTALPDTVGVDRRVLTTTRSLYAQLQVQPIPTLKLTAGVRYDHLDFDIDLHQPDDSYTPAVAAGLGSRVENSAGRVSPKFGAGRQLFDTGASTIDLYANYALGLKSPYAFSDFLSNVGASTTVPDLALSTLRSIEAGFQGGTKDGLLHWRAGLWDTRQEKEGQRNDAGIFEAFGKTTRRGFDLEGSAFVISTTRVYANYSGVRARSKTAPPGQERLPNVPEWIGALGVQTVVAAGAHRFELGLEDSIVGPQPVTADNTLRGHSYNRVTARVAYTNPAMKGATGFVSLTGYDRQYDETRFDFGGGVTGVSPRPRLQATAGVQFPINF